MKKLLIISAVLILTIMAATLYYCISSKEYRQTDKSSSADYINKSLVNHWAKIPNRVAEEEDIRESTFRYQFTHNHVIEENAVKSIYIQIYSRASNTSMKDPDDVFMTRFSTNNPPVRKGSEHEMSPENVIDKKTGENGILFRNDLIYWRSATDVRVRGTYVYGRNDLDARNYHLTKALGKWLVIKESPIVIGGPDVVKDLPP
jgi:hypothetical protein